MTFRPVLDGVDWVLAASEEASLLFFCTSTYLNTTTEALHGRLAYSTAPPFGSSSIAKTGRTGTWYKVIHRRDGEQRTAVSVDAMLEVAAEHGFRRGAGLHRNLVRIAANQVIQRETSPSALSVYPDQASIIEDVAATYQVEPAELMVTGAASAIGEDYASIRDLDVVVPIRDPAQAHELSVRPPRRGRYDVPVGANWARALGREHSSIRWRHNSGMIVCPFFIYREVTPPVVDCRPTGRRVAGRVEILSAVHGRFNSHAYLCRGAIRHILICSTLGRGEVRAGLAITIDCPIFEVTRGAWEGSAVAIVNSPHLGFDRGHLEGQ